jgi:putative glutamine amidotransferase
MKIVAVSQRVDHFIERNETRDALDQHLIHFLLAAGFIPFPVPNRLSTILPDGQSDHEVLDRWLGVVKPQGFILSGGNDIGQSIERDLTEGWLLDFAQKNHLPVLGICRGMQIMAHWAGTSLRPVERHVNCKHYLTGQITGEVNSYHSFSLDACPKNFEVIASSVDGEIEAIRHLTLPWEGWMWHPERYNSFTPQDLQRIITLFKK